MAKNKEAVLSVLNVTWRLLVICLAVAALVALAFEITEEPIAAGERDRKEAAIRTLFTDAAAFDESSAIEADGVNTVYTVKNSEGTVIGLCIDYTGKSNYGGDVNMMVGVSPAGKVIGLQIISHAETFMDRYTDENGYYTGIDAPYGTDLSAGATMSYRAIREAITAIEALCQPDGEAESGDTLPETDAPAAPEMPEQTLFGQTDLQQLFANGVTFLRHSSAENGNVNAVFSVRNTGGELLGHCIAYTSTEGYRGNIELLMARNVAGKVTAVKVLSSYDEHMGFYVNENGLYTPDTTAGATSQTYRALQNAIAAVEALPLGGAA